MQLAAFQDAFATALQADGSAPATSPMLARLIEQPGFAVYRNTVLSACIDALLANYPAVERLVGAEWLRATAAVYARRHLPSHPILADYGHDFPAFLARFEPARELPYLPAVAQLDREWSEVHAAADVAPLDAGWLATCSPAELARTSLVPHPAARWRWDDGVPIYTLWSGNRFDSQFTGAAIDWQPEGVLLTRPGETVLHCPLARAAVVFLDACAQRASLPVAAGAALAHAPALDFALLMRDLLLAGAFGAAILNQGDPE
jgi:hypothetical protein